MPDGAGFGSVLLAPVVEGKVPPVRFLPTNIDEVVVDRPHKYHEGLAVVFNRLDAWSPAGRGGEGSCAASPI